MKIKRIDQGSLSVRAYAVLREGLISGQFKPGQRLVMQDLADLLGTSITPVREACLRLVSEKGLELRSGRFAIVPEMTRTRYLQVKIIRLALEGLATELAAEHATSADIARLSEIDELYAKYDLAGDSENAFRYNREFHFGIYRLSGMDMLVDQIENLWVLMGPMFTIFFQQGHHQLIASSEHKATLAALSRGDKKAARRAMQDDIIRGGSQ